MIFVHLVFCIHCKLLQIPEAIFSIRPFCLRVFAKESEKSPKYDCVPFDGLKILETVEPQKKHVNANVKQFIVGK